jgi:hypothetical protein
MRPLGSSSHNAWQVKVITIAIRHGAARVILPVVA